MTIHTFKTSVARELDIDIDDLPEKAIADAFNAGLTVSETVEGLEDELHVQGRADALATDHAEPEAPR